MYPYSGRYYRLPVSAANRLPQGDSLLPQRYPAQERELSS